MFYKCVTCLFSIPQELIVDLQNNFIKELFVSMELDTIWWLIMSVMMATHWLDHQPEFARPVESGLGKSRFVKVRKHVVVIRKEISHYNLQK